MRFALPLAFLLMSACAFPPRGELQTARMAVSRAYHAGAEELAPEEYRLAVDTLRRGEELVRDHNFDQARVLLPEAESQARQALTVARREKERLERLRLEDEEKARLAPPPSPKPRPVPTPVPAPPPAPPRAKPTPSPASPSHPVQPPLTRYQVGSGETLRDISAREEVYADPLLWPLLYQANRDQIRDPRRLYRGQVLTIPRNLPAGDLEEAREKARRSDIFPTDRQRPSRNP